MPSNKYYTKFPQFIKIITHSQDFPMSRKTEILAKEQDKHKIINQINNECFEETGQNLHYFSDGHVYYNLYGPKYCIDKEFFHRPI